MQLNINAYLANILPKAFSVSFIINRRVALGRSIQRILGYTNIQSAAKMNKSDRVEDKKQ